MRTWQRALLGLLAIGLASCGSESIDLAGGGTDGTGIATGSMTLRVTDAPVDDVAKVVVAFTGVELVGSGKPQQFFFDEPKAIDLLEYQDGKTRTLLDEVRLPADNYTQIRLLVNTNEYATDSYVLDELGGKKSLFVPSGQLIVGPLKLARGSKKDVVVDFVLRKALIERGNSNGYTLTPKNALRLIDAKRSGEIRSQVDSALLSQCGDNDAAVYVYAGAEAETGQLGSDTAPITTAEVKLVDGDWRYTAAFLEPGDYTVALTCDAENDHPESADDSIKFLEVDGSITVSSQP